MIDDKNLNNSDEELDVYEPGTSGVSECEGTLRWLNINKAHLYSGIA